MAVTSSSTPAPIDRRREHLRQLQERQRYLEWRQAIIYRQSQLLGEAFEPDGCEPLLKGVGPDAREARWKQAVLNQDLYELLDEEFLLDLCRLNVQYELGLLRQQQEAASGAGQ